MKKTGIILVVLALLVSLCACGAGSDADKLVGTWNAGLDMGEALADSFESMKVELPDASVTTCKATFEFTKDGNCTYTVDQNSFQAVLTDCCDILLKGFAEQNGTTIEELDATYEQISGQSFSDLLKSEFDKIDASSMSFSGAYTVKGDVINIGGDDVNFKFIDDNTVELTIDEANADPNAAMLFPMTLTRG